VGTVKTKVPDGKGGWQEVVGEENPGGSADAGRQALALHQQMELEGAEFADWLGKVGQLRQREKELSPEQAVFGVALLCINMRERFPGGKEQFDAIATAAADYYDAGIGKKAAVGEHLPAHPEREARG
jgi:hypothetical protein